MNKKSRVTIKTVAADAGVSVSAVSKVLRDAYGVSESLREKVQASIAKLGYRPNTAARALRGKTNTIGVLVSDLRNPFVPDLIDGIREAANSARYRIMIGVGGADRANERDLANSMLDQQMDGLIMIGPYLSPAEIAAFGAQVPITCLAYHASDATNFDTINADDVSGARLAVEHLISEGHRKISMLTLEAEKAPENHVYYHREQGYRASMIAAGLERHISVHRLSDPVRRTKEWASGYLQGDLRPTAVFCWSDLDAIQLISTAHQIGITLPDELSIVGFDNSGIGEMLQLGLSSVSQDGSELGKGAAEILLDRINGRTSAVHTLLKTELVVRNSVMSASTD